MWKVGNICLYDVGKLCIKLETPASECCQLFSFFHNEVFFDVILIMFDPQFFTCQNFKGRGGGFLIDQ